MRNWRYTLDVKDIWDNFEENGFHYSRDVIVERIYKSRFWANRWEGELDGIVEEMVDSESLYDFNHVWNDFYDYADANDIWVKTF